ncbi:hypothetical protein [Helicobacter sp. MIT 14-3879]|uniref:hypothetical protein n=1 Tax=Helicobacter sp. MIT 14-3879 TaxID=2040649 RepID=UPI000E1F0767|nr:hypothetical protein [Helicobacter sp. MIT 14-3879]RDU59580.1 hypothetical protein CQA44_11335 [Helicobacter sp. MIT 14-3879]
MRRENKVKRILFLHSRNDLLREITTCTENARKITLHCSNFKEMDSKCWIRTKEMLSLEDWLIQHFFSLRDKNVTIEVYDYNSINQKNVVKNDKERDCGNIKIYNKQSDTSSILFNFVKQLNDGKDIDNLSEAIHKFLKQKNSFETLKACIENNLQKPIIEKLPDFEEIEFFGGQEKCEESLQLVFDNLIQDIKNIYEEGNAQAYKEIVNFFFSIINIFDIKKIFSKSNLAFLTIDTLFEGGKTLVNILEWADSKYSFAISNSIIKLFVQDIAPIIFLFENHILHYTLTIDDRILIELSGFKCDIDESKAYMKQDLALLVELEQESLADVQDINLNCVYKNEKLQICSKKDIANHLSAQMTSNNNRIVFIESPYFNSSKLVQLMKNEQEDNGAKNPSNQGYNYLIISQAPYKHNAGLSCKLLEELGNTISYGDENKKEVKSGSLSSNPKKDYNATIDYSKYKITIKDEITKPYVVSLSPFVFVPQKEYDDYKTAKKELDTLHSNLLSEDKDLIEQYYDFEEKNRDKILNFNFIERFFRQENNKKYFLEQEKKYFKESIECLQGYIDSLIKVLVVREYEYQLYGYKTLTSKLEPKKDYSVLEVLLLALTYYMIKNFYTSIKTNTQQWWNFVSQYEGIKIDKESLEMLPFGAFLELEESKIPLCFSKQRKEKLLKDSQEVFCIEEFVIELENQEDTDEINLEGILEEFLENPSKESLNEDSSDNLDALENKLQELEEKLQKKKPKEDLKVSESLQVMIEHFITSFFPFASLLLDLNSFNISKKFVKLFVSYKIKTLKEVLFEELGLAYIAYIVYHNNMNINSQMNRKNKNAQKFKSLKRKSFVQAIKLIQNSVVTLSSENIQDLEKSDKIGQRLYKNIFLKDYAKDTIKDFFKSLPQAVGLNIFNQLFITHYEKSKKEFERLSFTKLSYKYNPPYVLKRQNEGVFYPMLVNNTFLSFNFVNMMIGGKLRTGAFGDIDSLFYCYEGIKTTNTRNYLLNKLLAYLCLDELRGMNDKCKALNDIEFFNTRAYTQDLPTRPRFLKLKHEEGEFKAPPKASEQIKINLAKFNKKMQRINQDERKQDLYNQYRSKEREELKVIDAYHTAMNYLDDVYRDCFNTNLKDNTPNLEKHREFLRALNIIGENNIKALYVGLEIKTIKQQRESRDRDDSNEKSDEQNISAKDTQEKRPKLVGRLATTIIMKDGLHIG